mmetsp:Transcript_21959/g.32019  ORF Transcript_21959/g.32019 Transcript_21959/m.32019 type:complete len:167 (+) Transcript_21959:27-527(+)
MFRTFKHASMVPLTATLLSYSLSEPNKQDRMLPSRPHRDIHVRTDAMKHIAADCKQYEHFNLYDTPAHRVLLTSVHNKCDLLTKNRFVGRNGSHARLVCGPDGVGKSTVLETYSKLCSNYYPDVLPIYVNLNDLNVKGKEILEYVRAKLVTEFGLKLNAPIISCEH